MLLMRREGARLVQLLHHSVHHAFFTSFIELVTHQSMSHDDSSSHFCSTIFLSFFGSDSPVVKNTCIFLIFYIACCQCRRRIGTSIIHDTAHFFIICVLLCSCFFLASHSCTLSTPNFMESSAASLAMGFSQK